MRREATPSALPQMTPELWVAGLVGLAELEATDPGRRLGKPEDGGAEVHPPGEHQAGKRHVGRAGAPLAAPSGGICLEE